MNLAPIILFVYNRPNHTYLTIEALKNNYYANQSELIVYSDGAKDQSKQPFVKSVRDYLNTVSGFKSIKVISSQENKGLANSIISGVTEVIDKYGKVIVLEDDLVSSPYMLLYMNRCLEFYQNYQSVFSVSAYNHPPNLMPFPEDYEYDVYCSLRNLSWGWASWSDRWKKADWQVKDFQNFIQSKSRTQAFNCGGEDMTDMLRDQILGKIDSWAICWSYAHFQNHAVSICPVKSYINNIGLDGSGTHCDNTKRFGNDLSLPVKNLSLPETIYVDERIMESFRNVYKRKNNLLTFLPTRVINKLTQIAIRYKRKFNF